VVARELVDRGIAWRRIQIVAAGDHEPIEGHPLNTDDDAPNRRVELRLTDRLAVDDIRTETAGQAR
jgi:outer membrane protein OmpA-like peptidoglycan-associated protein